ncbi:MAG: HEAT repeat domain-containing protein [Phycisphaerae bacterium]
MGGIGVLMLAGLAAIVLSRTMGLVGDRSAESLSQQSLEALGDPVKRQEEIRRLARSGRADAVPALASLMSLKNAADRRAAVEAMGQIGGREAVAVLKRAAGDEDETVRQAAAVALAENYQPSAKTALASLVRDRVLPVRRAAVTHLAELVKLEESPPGVMDLLTMAMDDPTPSVRMAAVKGLARSSEDRAAEAMTHAIRTSPVDVRRAIVRELATRSGAAAWRGLAIALSDSDQEVRKTAENALKDNVSQVLPHLHAALETKADARFRASAARAMGSLGRPEVVPVLLGLLQINPRRQKAEHLGELSDAVVDGIAAMGTDALEPIIRETIQGEMHPLAEQAAARACVRIGPPAAEPVTEALLQWTLLPDPAEAKTWIAALGDIGDPAAKPAMEWALAQGITGMDEAVAQAARRIESRSGQSLGNVRPADGLLAGTPEPEAWRRIRPGSPRVTPEKTNSSGLPDDGVVRLTLTGAVTLSEGSGRGSWDLEIDLIRKGGRWEEQFYAHAPSFNKRTHLGTLSVEDTADGQRLSLEIMFQKDFWRKAAFGEYTLAIQSGGELTGDYSGHCNYEKRSGRFTGHAYELPDAPAALDPVQPEEHPRLLFRPRDLTMLRQRARTPFGRAVLLALRRQMAGKKRLYREPVNWVTTWQPGMELAIGHGFIATLFDDRNHGLRAVPLVIDRTRTMPYHGEHGERVPGPISHYPFGYDLARPFMTAAQRDETLERQAHLSVMFKLEWGPQGVFAAHRSLFACPGSAALAVTGEKDEFDWPEPSTPPTVVTLEPTETDNDAAAVNDPTADPLWQNWLVVGPFPLTQQHPLDSFDRGPAVQPVPGTTVRYAGKDYRFVKAPKQWWSEVPGLGKKGGLLRLPGASGTRSFAFSVLNVQKQAEFLLEKSGPFGRRWSNIWLNGREVESGTIVILKPGRHRVLVEIRGRHFSPYFPVVDAGFARARNRQYQHLLKMYQQAKARHAQTGQLQTPPVKADWCGQAVRTAMMDRSKWTGRSKGGKFLWPFVSAKWISTGRGLYPDTPLQFADIETTDQVRRLPGRDLCFLLAMVPEESKKLLVAEFNRRYWPDKLTELTCLELAAAFVNYPLDLAPKSMRTGE